jgi:hypothetical protein
MKQEPSLNSSPGPAATPEKLALARQAFKSYYARCFWFLREDLQIGPEHIKTIVRGLRAHGDREAFRIAARLCR